MSDEEQPPRILSGERKEEIAAALAKVGATKPCPRCDNETFFIVDGYDHLVLNRSSLRDEPSGRGVPLINVMCSNCGWLAQHAIFALDINPIEHFLPLRDLTHE